MLNCPRVVPLWTSNKREQFPSKMPIVPKLEDYFVSETHGFLLEEPVESLPAYFTPWEEIAVDIAHLLTSKKLKESVDMMPLLDETHLQGYRQHRRAHLILCLVCNGYVWQDGDDNIPKRLPRQLAMPLCNISNYLGVKPGLGHPALVLANWKLIDPHGNLKADCHLPGGRQFEWFVVVTAEVEKNAVPGIKACAEAQKAAYDDNEADVIKAMGVLAESIASMRKSLRKMYDGLESSVFFNVFRPFLSGWGGDGSPLKEGLIYEGISETPQKVIGGSAAQSSILPCFDAVLGIEHDEDRRTFVMEMMNYMPPKHREFIMALKQNITLDEYVHDPERKSPKELIAAYKTCIKMVTTFRSDHIQLVTKFIVCPANQHDRNKEYESVAKKGTGGTPLIQFLKGMRDSTKCMERD